MKLSNITKILIIIGLFLLLNLILFLNKSQLSVYLIADMIFITIFSISYIIYRLIIDKKKDDVLRPDLRRKSRKIAMDEIMDFFDIDDRSFGKMIREGLVPLGGVDNKISYIYHLEILIRGGIRAYIVMDAKKPALSDIVSNPKDIEKKEMLMSMVELKREMAMHTNQIRHADGSTQTIMSQTPLIPEDSSSVGSENKI